MSCNEILQGTKQNGIKVFHLGIRKDRKDAVFVKYLSNGKKISTVHAVTTN